MEELIEKLKEAEHIAKREHIPFFAAIPISNTEEDTKYQYFHATPFYTGKKLTKDYISQMLLVINGFKIQKGRETDVEGLLEKARGG